MKKLIPFAIFFLLIGCTSHQKEKPITPIFLELDGLERVSDSIAIYRYKDTLYYYNEASECLFKIPSGFKFANGSDWGADGVHFWNADSAIVINLTCLDRGFSKSKGEFVDDVTKENVLTQVACDNADIRLYCKISDKGYLKVGFTPDFKPMLEKCVAHFDSDEDMVNEHLHIVRLVYPDTLAKQAFNINWDYIEPWSNNFYK